MRVFLCGATGFIGGHTLRALLERGHSVTCLVRDSSRTSLLSHPLVTPVDGEWIDPAGWIEHVASHDAVINTVGVIRERGRSTFQAVHTEAAVALFDAAKRAGVSRVVQLSALGADEHAVSQFHLTKRAADDVLRAIGVPFVILRPSFVYGPGDHSMTFFKRLASLPITPVPGDGQFRVQPLDIADLTPAIVDACERPELRNLVTNVGGATTLTFNDLLDALARQSKQRDARKLHIPWGVMRMFARATDALGNRGPITSDELRMLRRGSYTDNQPFIDAFGFAPRPFAP